MATLPFTAIDYAVITIVLLMPALISIFYRFTGGRQKTTEEYLLGDRGLSFIPVGISIFTTYLSGISLFGLVAEYYLYGSQFLTVLIGYSVAIPVTAYLYLPVFFKLQKVSTFEYLELRFGPKMRIIGSAAYSLQQMLYSGIVLYIPALALEAVTGLDKTYLTIIVGLVCTFYATVGGIKAIVMTDVFQMCLIVGAVLSIVFYSTMDLGGFANVWQIAEDHGRISFNEFRVNPTVRNTWWSTIFGAGTIFLTSFACNHAQIQRLLTVRTLKESQMSILLAFPFLVGLFLLLWWAGLSIFAKYKDCDPFSSGRITAEDQILAFYVVDVMTKIPGLLGLFVAGVISATLSTISGVCNALAAVVIRDYMPFFEKRIARGKLTGPIVTKVSAMAFGFLVIFLALFADRLGGVIQGSFIIQGSISGPLLAVFTLGMFTTSVNEMGAIIGFVSSLIFMIWINIGGSPSKDSPLPLSTEGCFNFSRTIVNTTSSNSAADDDFSIGKISHMWGAIIGMLFAILVAYPISLWNPRKLPWRKEEKVLVEAREERLLNPDLYSPIIESRIILKNKDILERRKETEELQSLTAIKLREIKTKQFSEG